MSGEDNDLGLAAAFRSVRPRYERLTSVLKRLLTDMASEEQIRCVVEARTKRVESFVEKSQREGKDYSDPLAEVTDLAGARVVVQSLADRDRVVALLHEEFDVDPARSVDKATELGVDRFGYLANQYVLRLKSPRTEQREYRDVREIWAEVQVRTVLQDAWAKLSYFLLYKNSRDIPRSLRRRFYAVAAVFELTDRELDSLLLEAADLVEEKKREIASSERPVELTAEAVTAYLESSSKVEAWARRINHRGIEITGLGTVGLIVDLARRVGLTSIAELDQLLDNAEPWGDEFISRWLKNNAKAWGDRGTGQIRRSGVLSILLVGSHPDILTASVLERDFGYRQAWRLTEAAAEAHRG
jgi:putative GTP pyrophosphokinase